MNLRDHLIKRMLQGIYPVQDYESARYNPQYMKLVAYFKRIEEDFFNTCRSKEEYFSKLADKYKQVQAEIQRTTPRAVGPGGVNQPMAAHQPAPFNPDASNPFPGAYTPSPSVMDSIPMSLPTDPVRPIPSVPQSSASPGPTSEQSTQDMKVTAKPLTNGLSMGTDGLSAIAEYWGLMYTCTYSKPSHSSRCTYIPLPFLPVYVHMHIYVV
jgi:hypothetical protein